MAASLQCRAKRRLGGRQRVENGREAPLVVGNVRTLPRSGGSAPSTAGGSGMWATCARRPRGRYVYRRYGKLFQSLPGEKFYIFAEFQKSAGRAEENGPSQSEFFVIQSEFTDKETG